MMLAEFVLLLLLTGVDGDSSDRECSYQEVLNHLNLTKSNELFFMTRPVRDYRKPTEVGLEVLLYAILDVREIDQTFVPYVWILLDWQNDLISWNPSDFCGIENITLPTDILWKPDLTIEEMTEKDKAPPSPYLIIYYTGRVYIQNDHVLVSTCRMQVYNFPFDVQSCTLSFKSVVHSIFELRLMNNLNSSATTKWSREVMRTQYEWLFIDMTVDNKTTDPFGIDQDVIIYTINMRRRSVLYIVNFLLPILFFLCLDLASFLISDRGGEKLSFKVTVLLAVTVMQLILNEILPASSSRIPMIATYCIGIFGLMLLSLLETIVVMYLMERDLESHDDKADGDRSIIDGTGHKSSEEEKKKEKWTLCSCIVSADETPTELLKCSSSSALTEQPHAFESLASELKEVVEMLTLLLKSRKEDEKPGYWTKMTKTINKIYFVVYLITASLFLFTMFSTWEHEHK